MRIRRLGLTAVALGLAVAMSTGGPASASGTYSFAGAADWDNDGHTDLIARKTNNDLWVFPGESSRGVSGQEPVQIGTGW
ncbi:hypothetical protein ACPPVO_41535 [Dactylosporangium sp. McL0621]|uniref:hypothetical protein n=1 Tax=Dactylosporangium sp. McL0621 TaxID=3415678 RepID=UPI003CEF7971